jgi:hypothetical protein
MAQTAPAVCAMASTLHKTAFRRCDISLRHCTDEEIRSAERMRVRYGGNLAGLAQIPPRRNSRPLIDDGYQAGAFVGSCSWAPLGPVATADPPVVNGAVGKQLNAR